MAEVVTDKGLNLPSDITEDQFFEAGRFLARIERGMQWAIGDWYNAIPWGDKEAACERAGLNYNSASKYAVVCDTFPILHRMQNLGFAHHQILAIQALTQDKRLDLLEESKKNEWTAARLKKERDILLGKPAKVPLLTFDNRVDDVLQSLPKSATNKVKKEIKQAMERMRHDFEMEVHHHAQEKTKEQREKLIKLQQEAEEEKERVRNLRQNLDGLMTEAEYRLIRGCLHPDHAPQDKIEKFNRAYDIFTRLEKSVNREMPEKLRNQRGWS